MKDSLKENAAAKNARFKNLNYTRLLAYEVVVPVIPASVDVNPTNDEPLV